MTEPNAERMAKHIAYDYVKGLIVAMDPQEGQFIKEEQVAEATGISRTPVREAFLRLEAERLIRLVPKKGAFVPPVSDREILDLMELRLLLEEFAALHAMGTPGITDQLEDILGRQRAEAKHQTTDVDEFIELDLRFHVTIAVAAGNHAVADTYESLRNRQLRLGLNVIARSSETRFAEAVQEHAAIVAALRSRDVDAVRSAIRDHIGSTLAAAIGRPKSAAPLFRTLPPSDDLTA